MERLLATLKSMVRAYDRLLALSRRKQGHLIKGEVEPLSALLKEEGGLLQEINRLEEERQAQVNSLAEGWSEQHGGPPPWSRAGEPTFSQLMAHLADSKQKAELSALGERLTQLIRQLQAQNQLNQRLTQDALHMVTHTIQLLTQSGQEVTYQNPGQPASSTASPHTGQAFFDTKA